MLLIMIVATFARNYQYNTRFHINKTNFADTIDIEWQGNQIYLKGMVGGKPCRINLDTGSSMGMVTDNLISAHYKQAGNISVRDANGQVSPLPVVILPELKIGSLTIKNYPATVRPKKHANQTIQKQKQTYDMILGFDLINKGLIVKIDVKAGKMIITDQPNLFKKTGYSTKYRLVRHVPNIKLQAFASCHDEAIIDTGSPYLYEMSGNSLKKFEEWEPTIKEHITENKSHKKTIGIHGTESSNDKSLKLDNISLLGHAFKNITINTISSNSRIGAQILNYGCIIIDGKRKEITFEEN